MLIYHPAFDIYHATFRLLRLLVALPSDAEIEVDRLRILDFYLLFPTLLRHLRFPIGTSKLKKHFEALDNAYESIEDPKALFHRLEPYQRAALEALAARGLVDANLLSSGRVKRAGAEVPPDLQRVISARNENSTEVALLTGPLLHIDLYGKSGLKDRTDLFEYRYDA